jgi:hypothetical protein
MKIKLILCVSLFASIVNAVGQDDVEGQRVEAEVVVEEPGESLLSIIRRKCNQMSGYCREKVCKKPACYRLECACCVNWFSWDGMMGSRPAKCCSGSHCFVKCVKK